MIENRCPSIKLAYLTLKMPPRQNISCAGKSRNLELPLIKNLSPHLK